MTKADYPTTLDEIDQWLFDSFGILPGCCSSIESVKHTTARMVAEALWPKAKKDLGWHSVDESLPPMDEEVIVLLDEWNEVRTEPLYRIAFGHIVNKEYCEDFSGWNIPGVRYWMPMPEIQRRKRNEQRLPT